MKQVVILFLILPFTVPTVSAEILAIDPVPSATLLLPFFFVETGSSAISEFPGERDKPFNGVNTVVTIHNNSDQRVLAHVTLRTDWDVPTLFFDVGLEPHGTQELNLYHILNGRLPDMEPFKSDFPNCDPTLDYFFQFTPEQLVDAHTGQESLNDKCFGSDLGDDVARGYMTIDVANECSLLYPGAVGYFQGGGIGVASNDNVLFGEYILVDPANNFSHSENLVHIEADGQNPETSDVGQHTFYGSKLLIQWSAIDNREPLPTTWLARYSSTGIFDQTLLIVWRDSHESNPSAIECGTSPPWAPLEQQQIVIFDEDMDVDLPEQGEPAPFEYPFPLTAQMVDVGGPDLTPDFSAGWLYMNLRRPAGSSGPTENPRARQAFVTYILSSLGRFQTGNQGISLDKPGEAQ